MHNYSCARARKEKVVQIDQEKVRPYFIVVNKGALSCTTIKSSSIEPSNFMESYNLDKRKKLEKELTLFFLYFYPLTFNRECLFVIKRF